MNRKIIISLGIVALLLGYIYLSDHKGGDDFPDLKEWKGSSSEILIEGPGSTVKLVNLNGKWLINKGKFPADKTKVEAIEKKLRDLDFTDLISTQKFYDKYDLTAEKAVKVRISQGDDVVRQVMVGKKSSTGKHTYVRIDNKPEVYQVAGILEGDLKMGVEDLRDMEIFRISKDAVKEFEVKYRGRTFAFKKVIEKIPVKAENKGDEKAKEEVKKEETVEKWICKGFEMASLDKNRIDSFLSSFNLLSASGYPDLDVKSMKRPMSTVRIRACDRDIVLNIFKKKDNKYISSSSESPYVFTMDEWKVKKLFIENLEDYKAKK